MVGIPYCKLGTPLSISWVS